MQSIDVTKQRTRRLQPRRTDTRYEDTGMWVRCSGRGAVRLCRSIEAIRSSSMVRADDLETLRLSVDSICDPPLDIGFY